MKVLITGGTGFVGSHTVAAAQPAGHEVRLLVTTYPPSVWSPHDPHLDESCQIASNGLKGQFRFAMRCAMVIGDVRDVGHGGDRGGGFLAYPRESIRDTVRWLYEQGHVSAKQAGQLAEAAA